MAQQPFTTIYRLAYVEGQDSLSTNTTINSDAVDKLNPVIDQPDQQVDVAFALAALLGYFIQSDQDLVLSTNAPDGSGGDQMTLKAGMPLCWFQGVDWSPAFTQDVEAMFFNSPNPTAGVPANLTIRITRNSTTGE